MSPASFAETPMDDLAKFRALVAQSKNPLTKEAWRLLELGKTEEEFRALVARASQLLGAARPAAPHIPTTGAPDDPT